MSKEQNIILWIGLALVLVYLFTGNILSSFTKKTTTVSSPGPALTLADFTGLSSSVGNGQSNTNNNGNAKVVPVMPGTKLV